VAPARASAKNAEEYALANATWTVEDNYRFAVLNERTQALEDLFRLPSRNVRVAIIRLLEELGEARISQWSAPSAGRGPTRVAGSICRDDRSFAYSNESLRCVVVRTRSSGN
jgi:hypothetical protein